MAGGLFGFNVSIRGLISAQKSLDVVNHNISNVNTEGYSRQEAIQSAGIPMSTYDGTGMMGTGSDVTAIQRIHDDYLDFKYWSEQEIAGEWDSKKELLQNMEMVLDEYSETGYSSVINDFYSSLQEISKDPTNLPIRALAREKAIAVTSYFNNLSTNIENVQSDINNKVKAVVQEVNSLGKQIQGINKQIFSGELNNNTANDLRDKRNVLIDKLSRLIKIDVSENIMPSQTGGNDQKRLLIRINGKPFVDNFELTSLAVEQRVDKVNPDADAPGLVDLKWEDGIPLKPKGGEIKGYLEVRDGNDGVNGSPLYKGIPFYIERLNEFVRVFAKAFNEGFIDENSDGKIEDTEDAIGHVDGFGLDKDLEGPKLASSQIRFFTKLDEHGNPIKSEELISGNLSIGETNSAYSVITAKNFSISKDIVDSEYAIATSDVLGEESNTNAIQKLLSQRNNTHMFAEGAPEDFIKSLGTSLGVNAQQAIRMSNGQSNVLEHIKNKRLSFSGVSIDEEMSNMVKFQQAYSASAKMINTMSEIMDILINRTI